MYHIMMEMAEEHVLDTKLPLTVCQDSDALFCVCILALAAFLWFRGQIKCLKGIKVKHYIIVFAFSCVCFWWRNEQTAYSYVKLETSGISMLLPPLRILIYHIACLWHVEHKLD